MKQNIEIKTADGTAKAAIFRADSAPSKVGGAERGVVFYMDAMGPRPALDGMAQRLADFGYVVLLPDLFYRFGAYGPFTGTSFSDETAKAQIMTMVRGTTQEMTKRDTASFLDTLAASGVTGPVGAVGYCMGGGRAVTAAGAFPGQGRGSRKFSWRQSRQRR